MAVDLRQANSPATLVKADEGLPDTISPAENAWFRPLIRWTANLLISD